MTHFLTPLRVVMLSTAMLTLVVVAVGYDYFFDDDDAAPASQSSQKALFELNASNLEQLKEKFNAHHSDVQLMLFLSPSSRSCHEGAAALQSRLAQYTGPTQVIVVWQPVLDTDLSAPEPEVVAKLHDHRVWQLWDQDHLISDAVRETMRENPSSIPLDQQRTGGTEAGILWNAVVIFPPGVRWGKTLPAPAYLDGDVIEVADEVLRQMNLLDD